jgi:hypothetical protein
MVGGVMLIRKNPLGVRVSVLGSSLFLLANIVQIVWTYFISTDYGVAFSIGPDLVCFFACGAFCIALPMLTVVIPEGRAALYREPVILTFEEEE